MKIAGVATAFPPHYYDQETLLANLGKSWSGKDDRRLEMMHRNVQVRGRHLALPLESYEKLATWGQANDAWLQAAIDLGSKAVERALRTAGIPPADVGALIFSSITGISTPSVDAHIINRLGLPAHIRRMPLFGLGCVAGAAGLSRAADDVRAYPDQVAVLVTVELCSLTMQRDDTSVANLVATGLFGDGAAAAVVSGSRRQETGPTVVASQSIFYPGSEDVMGWRISERGFAIVLSADVPDIVGQHIPNDVDRFLAGQNLTRADMAAWICHPGGPRVLEALSRSLELPDGALDLTWQSLRRLGNVSSASVLAVLADVQEQRRPAPGAHGLLMAMGPGFCSELVLLRW